MSIRSHWCDVTDMSHSLPDLRGAIALAHTVVGMHPYGGIHKAHDQQMVALCRAFIAATEREADYQREIADLRGRLGVAP